MKKTFRFFFLLYVCIVLVACKGSGKGKVSIGNLAFKYDKEIWEYIKPSDENAPLQFVDDYDNIISFFVTQESTYQHPLEMINMFKELQLEGSIYTIYLEPTKIEVNGETWYEFGYQVDDGTTKHKVYQRYYGQYYNAVTVSYNSTEENFDKNYEEALKIMSDIKIEENSNEENESKARKHLVGEWVIAEGGYIVFNNDNTYEWYKDDSKDKNNYHYGTYGCDIENETLGFEEGDGLYLVFFPQAIISNGKTEENLAYKSDFLISFKDIESNQYQMVNTSSYRLYSMTKMK